MQRKKKVETYDGEIDYFAPAAAQSPQQSHGTGHVQNGAAYGHVAALSTQAPTPVTVPHFSPSAASTSHQMEQQPVQPMVTRYEQKSASPPPPPLLSSTTTTKYTAWQTEQPNANNAAAQFTEYKHISTDTTSADQHHDHQQLSPIAVPTSLRPISKGIKRSPSAGIISALAAAESMARNGSSTNASASPAPSVSGGDRIPSGGLPSARSGASIGGSARGSSNGLPNLFSSAPAPAMTAPVVEPEPYIATSFAVCNAPIFNSEDISEFDAIADSADALDSFNLDDFTPEVDTGAGSAWLPPVQAWQLSPTPAPEPQPVLPIATTKVEPAHVESTPRPSSHNDHQYPAVAASPSPSPVPFSNPSPSQQQQIPPFQQQKDDAEDFFEQIGDGNEFEQEFPSINNIVEAADIASDEGKIPYTDEQQQQQQVEDQDDLGRSATEVSTVEADEQQQQKLEEDVQQAQCDQPEVAPATEHTPGSTWYDDAGYCYYLSEDGWKYFWDNASQQWQAHEYIGAGVVDIASENISAGGQSDDAVATTTIAQPGIEEIASTEGMPELVPAPLAEASFCDFAAARAAASGVLEEDSTAAVAVWDTTNGQEFQSSNQYSYSYEQQQQHDAAPTPPLPLSSPQKQHSSFLPRQPQQQQQQHQPAGVSTSAHSTLTPSSAPSPATFLPNKIGVQQAHEPTTTTVAMHPSPYMQPSSTITTTAPPAWVSAQGAAALTGSPLRQKLEPHQHMRNQYQAPQQYHHQNTSLHPSCGFAKLAFGGRLVRVSPSGTITTHQLSALPKDVLHPVVGAAGHSAPTVSITSRHEMLNVFPGPLGNTLNKEKAAAFFAARKEACVSEEPGGDAAALFTLWSVLEAEALHPPTHIAGNGVNGGTNGNSHGSTSNNNKAADAALAAALCQHHQDVGGGASANVIISSTPSAAPSPAALQSIQDLVLHGRKNEALQAALQCHAWPLALILARSLGATEWQSAVEAFALASLSPGCPLNTVCMLVGGAGSCTIPDPTTNPTAAAQVLDTWRHHAAALAVGHMQGAEQALESLGDALLARGCMIQAHTCFVLAGVPLQPSDLTSSTSSGQPQQKEQRQFALVGASRIVAPRTYAALPAILRTEMFTWSRTVDNPQAVPNFLWVLPYKLIHAYALAEMGMLSQSSQYCSSILTTLQGLGTKGVPPGLAVCRASAADLNDRLQQLAAARKVSLAGSFNAGTIVSSVGKLLDRGISALMGGERQHSRSSSFTADIGIPAAGAGHSRRSSVTTFPSSPLKMPATTGASAPPAPLLPPVHGDDSHLQPPKLLSSFMNRVASIKSIVTPEPTSTPAGSGSGASAADPSEPQNTFYYDNELKIWRERGKAPPPPPEEPPPPPIMASWQTPPPATLGSAPPASGAGHHVSPMQQHHGAGVGGVSRYAMAPIGAAAPVAASPAQATSLLPPPTLSTGATFKPFNPAAAGGGAGAGHGAATFLTPPLGGGSAGAAGTSQHPSQFIPPQQASQHINSASGYYGQPAMEEMSEVEL